jgi:arylsulfatase A-like enzyme
MKAANILAVAFVATTGTVSAQSDKEPNILVIFGDDVGQTNISAYGQGVVGYGTPDIDRIAKEGALLH